MIFNRHTIPNAFAAAGRALRRLIRRESVLCDPEVEDERRKRCYQCPHRYFQQCSLCTCYISLKVGLASETCPDRPARWKPQTRFTNGL